MSDEVTLAVLKGEVDGLRDEIRELKESTAALVEAWNAASAFIKFVKLLSTVIAAVGAIWLFVKNGWSTHG